VRTWRAPYFFLKKVGFQALAPQLEEVSFNDCLEAASKRVDGQAKKA
jgi:hypothetical protein